MKRALSEELALKTKTTYHLTKKIDDLNNKINKAHDLLLQGDINGQDFKKIKTDSEIQMNILCEKLNTLQNKQRQLSKDVNTGLTLFSKLHLLYEEGDVYTKRDLIMQIFPEYLVSDGNCFHTTAVTDAVKILYNKKSAFTESFAYNNSIKKERLGLSDIHIIDQDDCNALKKIALSQQCNYRLKKLGRLYSI